MRDDATQPRELPDEGTLDDYDRRMREQLAARQAEIARDTELGRRAIEADRRERTHWDLYPYPGTD